MISDSAIQIAHAAMFRQQELVKEHAGLIAFAGGNPKEAARALERSMEEFEREIGERMKSRAQADQNAAKEASKKEG